ncbi:MAG: 4-hydroxybutyryl-CoA dehydratase, partial [Acidimicrobiia bacterium]|nr:4-hydroxybutyryl-CoA dehydratase [Acidimicrobiia bacterium]
MTGWTKGEPIRTGDDYVESLRNRNLTVFLMGEKVPEPVDHPIIRPSINALAATYDLAIDNPDLASAPSSIVDASVNRFLHVTESAGDVVAQNK